MPYAGDKVWVEFEGGDPSYPIFTDHFGLPTDERILAQLRDLDWPTYALGHGMD